EMSMQQRDGRKITVDPRTGVAYFPFVTVSGPFIYEMSFNNPELVKDVWVRMGPENNIREARAVRDQEGIYRTTIDAPAKGPVYVDFEIDLDKIESGQSITYDWISEQSSIQETVLSEEEEQLLNDAATKQMIVQGETFSWSYIELEDVVVTEDQLDTLIPAIVNGRQYYAEQLTFINNGDGFILGIYGEDLDELKLIDEEETLVALLSSELSKQTLTLALPTLDFLKLKK